MERVVHQTLIRKDVDSKQLTHALHVTGWSGEEVPAGWVGGPPAGVAREDLGSIVDGVEGDRQQNEIASQARLEARLQDAEVVGDAKTEVRQRTTRIDEVDGHDLAA